MNDVYLKACLEIKKLITSRLFQDAIKTIKMELATEMIDCDDSDKRQMIFLENKALERLLDRMQAYANEIAMLPSRENDNGR